MELGTQRINLVSLANARGGFDPVWLVLRAPGRREQAGKQRNFQGTFLLIQLRHTIIKS